MNRVLYRFTQAVIAMVLVYMLVAKYLPHDEPGDKIIKHYHIDPHESGWDDDAWEYFLFEDKYQWFAAHNIDQDYTIMGEIIIPEDCSDTLEMLKTKTFLRLTDPTCPHYLYRQANH